MDSESLKLFFVILTIDFRITDLREKLGFFCSSLHCLYIRISLKKSFSLHWPYIRDCLRELTLSHHYELQYALQTSHPVPHHFEWFIGSFFST